MKRFDFYESPLGRIGICEEEEKICQIWFDERSGDERLVEAVREETLLIAEAKRQLKSYFAGELQVFDLPLAPKGTEFQQKVWRALCEIPYGETRSYKEVAGRVGNERACRAVGMANNRNPVAIVIPCHRVVGADRSLTGYGGGLDLKEFLLELEKTKAAGEDSESF